MLASIGDEDGWLMNIFQAEGNGRRNIAGMVRFTDATFGLPL